MPSLGADMELGTVDRWLVKPGDPVHRGEIVAVVATEKADIDAEIFEDGVIEEILVPEGERVPVGTVLATVRPAAGVDDLAPARLVPNERGPVPRRAPIAAEPAGDLAAHEPKGPSPVVRRLARHLGVDLRRVEGSGRGGAVTRADVERAPHPLPRGSAAERLRASPLARRRAEELGVDLGAVTGSGPGGVVVEADVRRPPTGAAEAPRGAAPAAGKQEAMRTAIARLMARSKREVPHYYLETHIDLSGALAWLTAENEVRSVADRLLPSALLLKAVALAAREIPEMNGFWSDGAFASSEAVHLGVAISLRGGGLIAPALHDADRMGLDELMACLRDLVTRTRTGRLRGSEMSDPTITVTNLGDRGVETVHGVIYVPQVALVGFGRVLERPWAEDGMLGVRPVVSTTLAADHRASDGHRGGLFLAAIDRLLQTPEVL